MDHIQTSLYFKMAHHREEFCPFFFNLLLDEVFSIHLPPNTHLFAYANDLQLIATGETRFPNIQQALDLVSKC